ncbi:unnamed protein product [Malus baccata var. baccata]
MLLHFGHVPALVISSAEAAKDALKTNDLHCCSRPSSAGARRLTYNYLDIAFSPIIFRTYGTSFRGSKFEHAKNIDELIQDTEVMLGDRSAADYFPSWIGWVIDRFSGVHKEFHRISKELDGFFQRVIDNHLNPGRRVDDEQAHEDIVDVLLKIVKEQSEFGASHLGHNNIKAVLLVINLSKNPSCGY